MSIQVKFFGPLADAVGMSMMEMEGISDTDSLKQKMLNDFPKLKNYHFVMAVYKQIINSNQSLKPGDEVALLPPFAGG